jgi:pimeloyl-ACP methyl ester carboxylesterase
MTLRAKFVVLVSSFTVLGGGCGAEDPGASGDAIAEIPSAVRAEPIIHSIRLSTGVRLAYLEQGNPSGEPVIFLHGYTDSHHSFDRNLPLLSPRLHVYALDQRGHGGSEKPACCYEPADFAADVIAFMNALHIHRAALVGHSMGSLIAHKVAAEHPHRFGKLVLIGSAATAVGNPVGAELEAAVDTLTDPIDPAFVRDFQASTFFRPIPPSFLDTAVAESLRVPASIWKQTLDALVGEDHSAELPAITADTLVFWGNRDIFFSAEDQARLIAVIPRATLLVYEETGHGLHVEQPARFVRDLERFLR